MKNKLIKLLTGIEWNKLIELLRLVIVALEDKSLSEQEVKDIIEQLKKILGKNNA